MKLQLNLQAKNNTPKKTEQRLAAILKDKTKCKKLHNNPIDDL